MLYGYTYAWSKAGKYATKTFQRELKKISNRLGVPIDYGSARLSLTGLIIEDLRIGTNAPLVINQVRCQVGLLPWSSDFAKPTLIDIDRARIKTPLSSLEELGSLLQKSPQDQVRPKARNREKMIDQFFKALPASRVEVASAGLVILSDQGDQLLAFKGLKLKIDKNSKKLLFKIDRIRRANGPLDGYLQGRLETIPKGHRGDYRFFVRRKAGPSSKKNLWAIAGLIAKDASRWSMAGDFHALPTFIGNDLEFILGKNPKISVSGQIEGIRSKTSLESSQISTSNSISSVPWDIKVQLKSNQTMIASSLIHSKPVGPLVFQINSQGQWDIFGKQLIVKSGTLNLPVALTSGSIVTAPTATNSPASVAGTLQINFSGSVLKEASQFRLNGTVEIPTTSCESFIKGIPQTLVPLLHEFQLGGNMSGKLLVGIDTTNPEGTQIQLVNPQWNCQIKDTPYDLSTSSLMGSFEVQPKRPNPESDSETQSTFRIGSENRYFTPLITLPKSLIGAFIASEDANFYNHQGIETQAILGAFRTNFTIGRIAVGGSTITMQTAKNLFLSHDRTLSRKLQELFLAWHLEKTIPKDRILEIYLNIIEFGPEIFGLGHASQHFFDKDPKNLNLFESSFLANLLPNPKQRYTSFCQGKLTAGMSQLMVGLLKRMVSLGKISPVDFQQALNTGLRFNPTTRASDAECLDRTAFKSDKDKVPSL